MYMTLNYISLNYIIHYTG